MTALAADFVRTYSGALGPIHPLPVKAAEKIFHGALTCIEASSGLAVEATNTAGLIVAGVATEGYDNTSGANGVLGSAPARYCRVQGGMYSFITNGSPIAGALVYVTDDNTVTTVAANVPVGICCEPDPESTSRWYIWIPGISAGRVPGAAIINLTDSTGLSGTHDDTLAAVTVPADIAGGESPTEAEHNALLAVVRVIAQNQSDIAQKVLEILPALRKGSVISS